jgi:hypothetical protein
MTKAALSILFGLLATPAFAHPGGAHEHESLGVIEHLVLTALPVVVVAGLIGLGVYAYLRKR